VPLSLLFHEIAASNKFVDINGKRHEGGTGDTAGVNRNWKRDSLKKLSGSLKSSGFPERGLCAKSPTM